MAKIPAPDFKVVTVADFLKMVDKKPELREKNFVGYCSLSQTELVFGPKAQAGNRCLSCLPEDHFIMMPLEYVDEAQPVNLQITGSITSIKSFINRSTSSKIA